MEMTKEELASIIVTDEAKVEYAATVDKGLYALYLLEEQDVVTYIGSPLCDYIEDVLEGVA